MENNKSITFGKAIDSNILSLSKSEILEQVKEDAKKIVKKIKNGDQNAISEIYGGDK